MDSYTAYRPMSETYVLGSDPMVTNLPIGTNVRTSPALTPWLTEPIERPAVLRERLALGCPTPDQSFQMMANTSLNPKTYLESNENKYDFKQMTDILENLKQNNDSFQTNILTELRQLREAVENMRNSLQELPIRFADVMTHCLDLGNSRSENASVSSEPEVVDIFDKMDIKSVENGFIELSDKSELSSNLDQKSSSAFDKFVFEYNSYIDLDKWLKKD